MRLFKCQNCGHVPYFEDKECWECKMRLGFVPSSRRLRAMQELECGWVEFGVENAPPVRFCANAAHDACNWVIEPETTGDYCLACSFNRMVPDLTVAENLAPWQSLERAKHRLIYALLRLNLPLVNRTDDPEHGLAFEFLAEMRGMPHVLTGHDNGLITVALKEGDDAARAQAQLQLGEHYRTPLGHFRHEVGHHYWDLLVRDGGHLEEFRAMFGDEQADYAEALKAHYAREDDGSWRDRHVSLYASSHPWEDFAETWAHYLHIMDTLETAAAFTLTVHPTISRDPAMQAEIDFDPYRAESMAPVMQAWGPLVFAVNSLNRAMGQPDLYPFELPPAVVEKLGFIHALVHGQLRGTQESAIPEDKAA